MARKDINVHIRAKDDASRNAKKAADALLRLAQDGKKAADVAGATGRAFADMQNGIAKIDTGSLRDFGKIVGQMDKARAAVDRLGTQLNSNTRSFEQARAASADASRASEQLRAQIEREASAQEVRNRILDNTIAKQKANTEALKAAQRAQEALNGARRKGIATSGNTASPGVGLESGVPRSSARDSFSVFLGADIANAEAAKAKLNTAINGLNTAIGNGKTTLKGYADELRKATGVERELAIELERTGNSVLATRADLRKAEHALSGIEGQANTASAALGGLAANQEAVANASRKAAAQLVAMQARVAALTGKPIHTAVPKVDDDSNRRAQIENLRTLSQEYAKAQIAAQTLGKAMAQAEAPTDELGESFGRARAQVAQLKQAINEQRAALRTQGSFSAIGASVAASAGADAAALKTLGQIAPMAQRAAAAKNQMAQATDRASASLSLFGNSSRTTLSFLQRLRGEVLAVATSFIGFYAAFERGRAAVNSFQAVETAGARLGVAFQGDMAKVNQEIAWLNAQADKLGYTFEALAGGYGKISVAASAAGFSISETRDLFDSLSVAARVNNTSLDEMNGVLRAVEQMLSKGKVQAEELRGQLGDRMTAAFQTFATALGMTTEELDEALKKGEVYANRETMLKFAERLNQMYGSRLPKSMQTLSYALGQFQRDAEKANLSIARGLVPGLQDALKAFHEFANSAEGQKMFSDLGEAAGRLIAILAQIPKYFDLILVAAKAFVAVKIGQWVASLGNGLAGVTRGFSTYAHGLQLAARNGQQLNVVQRTLSLGLLNTTRAMAVYEARLRASSAASGTARFGTLAFASSLGLLRTAMLSTAAVARTMWAAVGGPVGLAVAGISVILMNWKTEADRATEALEAHERQIEAVRSAYQSAASGAKDWAKEVKGASLPAAVQTLKDNIETLEGLREPVARAIAGRLGGTIAMMRGDFGEVYQQIGTLTEQFVQGKISAENYANALNDIYKNTNDAEVRDAIEQASDLIGELVKQEKVVERQAKLVEILGGNLEELAGYTAKTADAQDVLGQRVEETNKAFDNSEFVKTYTAAIEDLKSQIPSLADEMKRLKDITELNATAWKGLVAAWNAGDYSKILEIAALWGRGQADFAAAAQKADIAKIFDGASGAGGATAAIIKKFEGFSNNAYWDVNAYRAGYGSDTVTLADGSIQKIVKGMSVTRADAERDLARRIVEFQNTVKSQIGEDRFKAFDEKQQGVLTSIAYNYGELPARIVDAVRNGSAEQIASAIRGLAGDNNGVNAKRRNTEAMIFAAGGDADINTLVEAEQDRLKTIREQNEATTKRIADLDHQIAQQKLINDGKEREAAIEDAIRQAKAENKNLSEQDIAAIRERTGALWDQQNVTKERELAEERINQLYELRQQLMEQRQMAIEQGDATKAHALKTEIEGVNIQLNEAIPKLIAMWQAVGGPEADAAIAKLNTMQMSLKASQDRTGKFALSFDTWFGVFQSAVQGVVGSFQAFGQAIAEGENAFRAFGQSALSVLASVLQQIAAAIIQMQILKMLQGFGGSIGQMATMMLGGMTGHTGGLVGSRAIGSGNAISSGGWVANAFAGPYHTGGIAGLRPDEVSATLKKNEEIVTEEDPRHRFNLGGESKKSDGTRLKQVLAIGDREIANAMAGSAGEKVQLTTIQRNAPTIRRILGL